MMTQDIPIEMELKLSVSPEMQSKFMPDLSEAGSAHLFARLAAIFAFAGFRREEEKTETHSDQYFDTDSDALETSGHCVRLRSGAGHSTLTVKKAGLSQLGIFNRPEYEAKISQRQIDRLIATGFDSLVRERFPEVGGKPLKETLQIETRRHEVLVRKPNEAYRVCLDLSTFIEPKSKARSPVSVEVEIEAQGNTTSSALEAVRNALAEIFPEFSPGQKSKQRRGAEFARTRTAQE